MCVCSTVRTSTCICISRFVSASILRSYSRRVKFNQVDFIIFLPKESSDWKSLLFSIWIASRNYINPITHYQRSLKYLVMVLSFSSFVCYEFEQSSVSLGLPRWLSDKRILLQCRKHGFDPWVRKTSWRRKWLPIPMFLPGKCMIRVAWWAPDTT